MHNIKNVNGYRFEGYVICKGRRHIVSMLHRCVILTYHVLHKTTILVLYQSFSPEAIVIFSQNAFVTNGLHFFCIGATKNNTNELIILLIR